MEPILTEVDPSEATKKKTDESDEEEDEVMDNQLPFTNRMRQATKTIHNMSDRLINAKLAVGMTDDRVWAEGLLIFYEVFAFLEDAIDNLKRRNEYFERFRKVLEGLDRKEAFEKDLMYYYGENWRRTCYRLRPELATYLQHLKILENREPLRLLAYIYHMYMGLLSGGQILKRKRDFRKKITSTVLGYVVPSCVTSKLCSDDSYTGGKYKRYGRGNCATDFSQLDAAGRSINDIKKDIAFTMNDIAEDLSKDERLSLLDESTKVFEYNNKVVATIQVSWFDAVRNVVRQPLVALLLLLLVAYIWYSVFMAVVA